eukprot:1159815-Pelagomonas_calceolata.AAC.3
MENRSMKPTVKTIAGVTISWVEPMAFCVAGAEEWRVESRLGKAPSWNVSPWVCLSPGRIHACCPGPPSSPTP